MVVKLIERGVPRQSTHALDAAQLVQNPPLSGALEKARCRIFREKFRSPASRKTLQSLAAAANIPCLVLFAMFLLRPMICALALLAEICCEILQQKIRRALGRFYSLL